MIAGPLLVLGLLLIGSAVLGARAQVIAGRGAVPRFLLAPIDPLAWRSTWALLAGLVVEAIAVSLIAAIFSAGVSLLVGLIGIPLIALGIEGCRALARFERRRFERIDGRPLRAHAYRRSTGTWRSRAETLFLDIDRWRDVVYAFVALPLAILEAALVGSLWLASIALLSLPIWIGAGPVDGLGPELGGLGSQPLILAVAAGFILASIAALAARGLAVLHRAVVVGLLCESERQVLEERVQTLETSRATVIDVEAGELRRIERDLHDGAQQRLVRLAMDLGMAADRLESDPAGARALVLDAQGQARAALAELRDLVRGIAPAILLDRGLVAAVAALAGRSPVPATVTSALPDGRRLPDAAERAAYYVVAEALANVAKHAGATDVEIHFALDGNALVTEIRDDGAGGARLVPAGGLAGLAGRVEALDGRLELESPAGGPTVIRARIPLGGQTPR